VGSVGKYRSAWNDSEWVTVIIDAAVGLRGVVLRCVVEDRARDTVRH